MVVHGLRRQRLRWRRSRRDAVWNLWLSGPHRRVRRPCLPDSLQRRLLWRPRAARRAVERRPGGRLLRRTLSPLDWAGCRRVLLRGWRSPIAYTNTQLHVARGHISETECSLICCNHSRACMHSGLMYSTAWQKPGKSHRGHLLHPLHVRGEAAAGTLSWWAPTTAAALPPPPRRRAWPGLRPPARAAAASPGHGQGLSQRQCGPLSQQIAKGCSGHDTEILDPSD